MDVNLTNMNFNELDQLNRGLTDQEKINYLKCSKLPIYLWGDGQYCRLVIEVLNKNEVPYYGIFTDSIGSANYNSLDEIYRKNEPFNIVIAHGNHTKLESFIKPKACKEIVILFDVFGFEFELNNDFILSNFSILHEIYNNFSDDKSKLNWISYLAARNSLNWSFIHPHITEEPYVEEIIVKDRCINNIVDVGACRGESIIKAYLKGYKWKNLFAFEPNPNNYINLETQLAMHEVTNVKTINMAVTNCDNENIHITINDDLSAPVLEKSNNLNSTLIKTTSIDSYFHDSSFDVIDYITFDVEGYEIFALLGSAEIIRKYKPVIKLSIYHRRDHLFELYNVLLSFRKDYNFIFRLYNKLGTDACLIAY